jgi:hypothetical protein
MQCSFCGRLLRRRDRIKSLTFCNGSCRALYYAFKKQTRYMSEKPKNNRLNISAGSLLTPVSERIAALGFPHYVHRDHIIDHLVECGKANGMSNINIKRSVSACIILNKYKRVSQCSNAYVRVDDVEEGTKGEMCG